MEAMRSVRMKPHWYFQTVYECVICGKTDIYRERRYGRKPVRHQQRYSYRAVGCDSHFL